MSKHFFTSLTRGRNAHARSRGSRTAQLLQSPPTIFCAKKKDNLILIGSRGEDSIEANELKSLQVSYRTIKPVKFDRYHKIESALRLPQLIIPIAQSIQYLSQFKAEAVVLFGSFNAVPVGIAAAILRIPIIIHEQTLKGGLANQFLKSMAKVCAVSYQSSVTCFPPEKTKVIGNLIRNSFWRQSNSFSKKLPTSKPIIYVTGGNQGSQILLKTL